MSARKEILKIIQANRSGDTVGLFSVCSSHDDVILTSIKMAVENSSMLLVESTSNQVNQFGGYTGLKPMDFADKVRRMAREGGLPEDRLMLGGDHLGPTPWQSLTPEESIKNSLVLVRDYVRAGYGKIHLDTSMPLPGDRRNSHGQPEVELVAERTALLCEAARDAFAESGDEREALFFVVGSEVPTPGGAVEAEEEMQVTRASEFEGTMEIMKNCFQNHGLEESWENVFAFVVQPGVEFGDGEVHEYNPEAAQQLVKAVEKVPNMVFEAHSTDYQSLDALKALNRDHFCVQKVGPGLTFAWREAVFALANIERELVEKHSCSNLIDELENVMMANPGYWERYYKGTETEMRIKRKYSYSDRCRYYWNRKELSDSFGILMKNLQGCGIPETLVSQYLPEAYSAYREGLIPLEPVELISYHVARVLNVYARACGLEKSR